MSKSKNRHYVSQCISKNFVAPDGPKNFWMYDCQTKQTPVVRNVDRLFSKRRVWDDSFEKLLSSDAYENKLAPILKKLVAQEIKHPILRTSKQITIQQFTGTLISNEEDKKILSKLLLQPALLQAALRDLGKEVDVSVLEQFYQAEFVSQQNVALIENNPMLPSAPLLLMDNMLFTFLSPSNLPNTAGQVNFFFPIGTHRFLLWFSSQEECDFFCRKYRNIHQLNLERIAQQNKQCQIATQNKAYLDLLIPQIEKFRSGDQGVIQSQRHWE